MVVVDGNLQRRKIGYSGLIIRIFAFSNVKKIQGFAQVLRDELTICDQPSIELGTLLKPNILEMRVRQSASFHPYASPPTPLHLASSPCWRSNHNRDRQIIATMTK